jgi:response regulator RpfG family c-di-GMP phosphodiesterase
MSNEDRIRFQTEERENVGENTSIDPNHRSRKQFDVLIVDDDEVVHQITKAVLRDYTYEEKSLNFISAMSSKEAKEILSHRNNIAVILLDVIMETENSGLDLVKTIRETMGNKMTRIILRTGQSGAVQEELAIRRFDINDFCDKTDVSVTKLTNSLTIALRAYSDLLAFSNSKKSLEKIIESSQRVNIFPYRKSYEEIIIDEINLLFYYDLDKTTRFSGIIFDIYEHKLTKRHAFGEYKNYSEDEILVFISEHLDYSDLSHSDVFFTDNLCFACINRFEDLKEYIIVKKYHENEMLDEFEKDLLAMYFKNISIANQNIQLAQEIDSTQNEIVITLGEVVEARSKETGNHVIRVSEISELLAKRIGLSEGEVSLIKKASPMHDLGKIAIPDYILNKPGRLTKDEFDIMKTHAQIGYDMLKFSNRTLLKYAAIIAHEHHEKYDGTGYPRGLKGEEISIQGRITALADVFDALGCDRVYRKAWPLDKVLHLIREEKGKHFDPNLVNLFFDHLDEILAIIRKYADTMEEVKV